MAPDLACGTIGVPTPTDHRTPEGATGSTQSILSWITCVTSNRLPSPSLTHAARAAAAIRIERPHLATIGRRRAGPTTAHSAIKRAWRLTNNPRVEVADARAGPIARLVPPRRKRLVVRFDGTEVRSFRTAGRRACGGSSGP